MIYETPLWGDKENVAYVQEVKDASYTLKQVGSDDITCYLEGTAKGPVAKAICNKDDTYDFETGALIALMKLCGREKVIKACDELYKDDNYKNALQEMTESFDNLSKKYDLAVERFDYWKKECVKLDKENSHLKYIKSCNESTIESLENTRDLLTEENNKLKEENEKLQHEYDLCLNSENALKCTVDLLNKSVDKLSHAIDNYKNDLYKVSKRCRELEAKEDILNKQEETINKREEKMSVYFGGRGNGKQYKALVELFKKIPKEKVQAAYVVAYKESLIWCTSQPSIRDSLDKLNEPISKLTVDSLIEENRAFTRKCVEEWLYGPPTKREEIWEKIFELHKESDVIIKVKREDINTFLHELENKIPEITWASGVKIFEAKHTIKDIFKELEICDTPYEIYFRLWKVNKLSYSSDQYIYSSYEFKPIDYIPPMRWDLFKKGRIVVGVKNNNELEEFRKNVEINTGIKDIPTCPTNLCLFYMFDKDEYKIILNSVTAANIAKINGHKVYYWEDVR